MHSLARVDNRQAGMDSTSRILDIARHEQSVAVREKRNPRNRPDPASPGEHLGIGVGVPDLDSLIGTRWKPAAGHRG